MQPLETVNQYLDVIFKQNGKGLSEILDEHSVFDDPFTIARSAQEFIEKSMQWVQAPKSIHMGKQFATGYDTCSIYTIEVMTPTGAMASFQLADYIEVKEEKVAKERVYFFDQVAFTKEMGFMNDYLKKYF